MNPEKKLRNNKIYQEYLKGRSSLRAIAKENNISHIRALQIINYMKKQLLSKKKTKKMLKVKHLKRAISK